MPGQTKSTMASRTQRTLEERVIRAAEAALADHHYVSALDISSAWGCSPQRMYAGGETAASPTWSGSSGATSVRFRAQCISSGYGPVAPTGRSLG